MDGWKTPQSLSRGLDLDGFPPSAAALFMGGLESEHAQQDGGGDGGGCTEALRAFAFFTWKTFL